MTEFPDGVPPRPRLGAAAEHRAAAENAAGRRDYDRALRERFRAVLRGLEQDGSLPVRRSRTAQETADDATTALPLEQSTELHPAARSFDEVVYGGRSATEDEYRRLEYADRYSQSAPPPVLDPLDLEVEVVERETRQRRKLPPLPPILRSPRFWAALAAGLAIALLVYATMQSCGAPNAPQPPDLPDPPAPPDPPSDDNDLDFGSGKDSIFTRLPGWLAFGGLQSLLAFVALICWRARRRGALVGEPRPVEVPANELLAGQAGLYRRSGDVAHVAHILRTATLRRIKARLGGEFTDDQLVEAVSRRLGVPGQQIGTVLFGDVPDETTLNDIAAHLEWIETELG
ncbi:DUF4129 domain-containing protein [Nocardia fluminea]|uniref:DUF4129 domain-containing protein n=1 Tax=Nocardia fluminea TaxID=134984 RepID=UPI00371D6072